MTVFRSFLIPLLAISATLLALWYNHRPIPVTQSNMGLVRQEAENGDYRLIDAERLRHLYQTEQENILLVDTRQEWEHRAGHIAGSLNFPIEPTWWDRWRRRGALKALLAPHKEKTIVFY